MFARSLTSVCSVAQVSCGRARACVRVFVCIAHQFYTLHVLATVLSVTITLSQARSIVDCPPAPPPPQAKARYAHKVCKKWCQARGRAHFGDKSCDDVANGLLTDDHIIMTIPNPGGGRAGGWRRRLLDRESADEDNATVFASRFDHIIIIRVMLRH